MIIQNQAESPIITLARTACDIAHEPAIKAALEKVTGANAIRELRTYAENHILPDRASGISPNALAMVGAFLAQYPDEEENLTVATRIFCRISDQQDAEDKQGLCGILAQAVTGNPARGAKTITTAEGYSPSDREAFGRAFEKLKRAVLNRSLGL